MRASPESVRLADAAPRLARVLGRNAYHTPARYAVPQITRETVMVPMRDGMPLATDIYLPPDRPAPTLVVRTPDGRGSGESTEAFLGFARRGFAVVAQDRHGTGAGSDLLEWISAQSWFDGFVGAVDSAYDRTTQWRCDEPLYPPLPPALLERYPDVRYLPPAQARNLLWERYCGLDDAERAEFVRQATGSGADGADGDVECLAAVFGHAVSHERDPLPYPRASELCASLRAPTLLRTDWHDRGLNDALATWDLVTQSAPEPARSRSRLFIGPDEPHDADGTGPTTNLDILWHWYDAVRGGHTDDWPRVIYYLMGANEWRVADDWPPPQSSVVPYYLADEGRLTRCRPDTAMAPDSYTYDPDDPAPTAGDGTLAYTTEPFGHDHDVAGPLRLVLYASSTAVDTDFAARLTDVGPDGRAVPLQDAVLRARYRDGEPEPLEPGRVYRFEIDMWATANRFRAGHRMRIDIASADFPGFDKDTNRGGCPGGPVPARQTIYHDPDHPSYLVVPLLG